MKKPFPIYFLGLFFIIASIASAQDSEVNLKQAGEYYKQGYFAKASSLYDTLLLGLESAKTVNDTAYLHKLKLAGNCYRSSGQYEKALQVFAELKKLHSDVKEPDSLIYASDLNDIAKCFYFLGKYDTALSLFNKSRNLRLNRLGPHHPDYAESIDDIGVLYCDIGKYTESLPLLEEAKKIRLEVLGDKHLDCAKSLDNLGSYYYVIGNYKAALPFFEQAVNIKLLTLGENHPSYARSLNNLAALYYSMGDYKAALPLYLTVSSIDKEKLGNRNLDYGVDLNNLAMLYKKTGNYKAALPLLKEFSSICKEKVGVNHTYYASSLMNLGAMYSAMYVYDTALLYYQQAKQIRQEQLGTNHADYARVLNNLALVNKNLCNYEIALSYYKEALNIYLKVFDKQHIEYARTLNNIAILYVKLGNYDEALLLYEEAIAVSKPDAASGKQDYSLALNNLGLLYSDMGNYEEAIRLLTKAAYIDSLSLGAKHPYYATDLINLANNYSAIGKNQEAIKRQKEATAIYLEKFGEMNQMYALSLSSQGRLFNSMGEYNTALPLFLQATAIYKEVLGIHHADYAMSLKNLALNYKKMGDYPAALPLLEEASVIYKELYGANYSDYDDCRYNMAEIYFAREDYNYGLPLMEEVNTNIKNRIRNYFSFLPESEKKMYMAKVGDFYDEYLSSLLKVSGNYPELCSEVYNNELFLKGVILSSVTSMQQSILESGDSVLIGEYEQMRMLKRQVNLWQQRQISERHADLTEIELQSQQLEKDITRHSQIFSEMQASFNVKWKDVQKQLKDGEVAIEFVNFRYSDNEKITDSIFYCALVLRKDDTIPQLKYLCEESQLKKVIPPIRAVNRGINAFYNGQDIYNLVWKPINSSLNGIQTIYFAPSGLLNRISMAAISCPDSIELLEKYKLIQLSSTRSIAIAGKHKPIKTAVIYGGIVYDTDSLTMLSTANLYVQKDSSFLTQSHTTSIDTRSGFRYLPGTLKEAEMIAGKLEKNGVSTKTISGTDAVEESFIVLSRNESPSIIHFSTHGFYFPEPNRTAVNNKNTYSTTGETRFRASSDPLLRSGLLMAGANRVWKGSFTSQDIEDGILTAKEVSNMNLMNTQLVVLSACQTGQGDVKGNEGVEGLQRGFKMAGARYMIMSLWEVPDKETTEFMGIFYDNWLEGKEIHEAFRNTQNIMNDKYKSDPFKWAAFVLVE
jgi:tetratricopeptide (TPR) repeat protein/CHAT domain-containing protein